jgi:hypothetical protein
MDGSLQIMECMDWDRKFYREKTRFLRSAMALGRSFSLCHVIVVQLWTLSGKSPGHER